MPMAPATDSAPLAVCFALLGACVGSFLNLVAWRLPRRQSVILPGSHCIRCGQGLAWFDNIPLLGWLLLAGRCRYCGAGISSRYPLVELLCAGLWVLQLQTHRGSWAALLAGLLFSGQLLVLALIDMDTMWLPEPLCRWGLLAGLLLTPILAALEGGDPLRQTMGHGFAALMGLLCLEAVSGLGQLALGVPALGLGDAKLAAMLGAWLGGRGLASAVLLAVFSAALMGVVGRLSGRLAAYQPFPFGPFLASAGMVLWCGGETLANGLLGLVLAGLI